MKRLLIILGSLFGIFIFFPYVFALTNEQKGEILKRFKAEEQEMIFESDSTFLDARDSDILKSFNRMNVYSKIGDTISSKREYLESQNTKIVERVNSLEEAIGQLDSDIDALVENVNLINAQIIDTKNQIETTEQSIDVLQKKIQNNETVLYEYLVYLYKKGTFVSTGKDIDNLKTILLSGEDIDELINDLHFQSIIQVTGHQLIEKHRKYISTLYVEEVKLKKSEQQLKNLRKDGIIEKGILDEKKKSKERLLEVTKGQEQLYQKYISDKLAVERDVKIKEMRERIRLNNSKKDLLSKYNCTFVDISTQSSDLLGLSEQCQDINRIIYAESRLTGTRVGNNPLEWPVQPRAGISAYFRDKEYQENFGTDHDALDIITPQGTDVLAPMDGYVIFIQPPKDSGYAYLALKHSDGLVTLYGHVSDVLVDKYEYVKSGQPIAKSGGEYGTKGAGILTTGPHLHFVVYENEEYVDPLEYLDTSYLTYNELPEKYNYKFLSDFKARKGEEYKLAESAQRGKRVFKIEGDNEVDRQKYLLGVYAVGPFRDWDVWVEESVAAGVDPTFLMCIGLAETSLGKHLKTPYNIGNVGNTDSGATITFPNARSGIHAMAKAFNNRYLSQYDSLELLSRYGNKDGAKPIYASSDFNWHNNITKCMSHVKGEYIPDDYNFRIR